MLLSKALRCVVFALLLALPNPVLAQYAVNSTTTVHIYGNITSIVDINTYENLCGQFDCGPFSEAIYLFRGSEAVGDIYNAIIDDFFFDRIYCFGSDLSTLECVPSINSSGLLANLNLGASGGTVFIGGPSSGNGEVYDTMSYGDQGNSGQTLSTWQDFNTGQYYGQMGTLEVTSYTYSFVITPEPSTWVTVLLGFAGLGFVGYRRARAGEGTLAA